ncbi:transposase-like zinc-binding domain-containing protein [Buchananella felis]|uniref:transposase-like zinc-binding domain-containing protein n=1 Tax=Buchananella felis TaxID=3231492 RepID=UPI003B58B293
MVRNGQTSTGKTRWRCKTCGASSVQHRPDITKRAQAEAFAAWLLGPVPQYSTGGTGRSFRAQTAWCWNIEIPQPAPTGEVHPVIMLDATYFQGWCLLVAYTGKHVIAWQWCDQEKKTARQALLEPLPAPDMVDRPHYFNFVRPRPYALHLDLA